MAEFIGIGDLHTTNQAGRGGLSKYIPNHDQFVFSEVQKVINYACDKGIKHVFLYGDLCEDPRMGYSGTRGLIRLSRRNKDITFHAILGNHDKFAEESVHGHSLELLQEFNFSNFKIYTEPTVVEIEGVKVNFLPWPSTDFRKGMLNVAHTEVRGSKSDAGKAFDGDAFPKTNAVVVMGHLHTNHRVRNTYYAGTLYQTNFGESLKKYFHHITYDSDDEYEVRSVRHKPKYTLHTVVVDSKKPKIPDSKYKLVKLIINDGIDYTPPVQSNIVMVKPYKTKSELTQILTEDLLVGQEIIIRSKDFFVEWLAAAPYSDAEKKAIQRVRKRVLANANA